MLIMYLLLGLCLLFFSLVNVGGSYTDCTEMVNVYIHKFPSFFFAFFIIAAPIFPLTSSFFLSFFPYDFITLTTLLSEPSGRFLQHFNQVLKITIFSFIHTGFAIMQPLCTGRLEVNPLSHQYPYKLLSDSSAPNTETNLASLSLVHNLFTDLVFPQPSSKATIAIYAFLARNHMQFFNSYPQRQFISSVFCRSLNIFCII